MTWKKVTFTELILKALLLFPIFTLVQENGIFTHVNKIWMVFVAGMLVIRFREYLFSRLQMVMLILTLTIHLVALYFTELPFHNFNMVFYFGFWVLLYLFFAKSKDSILEILDASNVYIDGVLWVWTGIVALSAVLPSSYTDGYFYSFAGHSFRLLPAALVIMALTMYMAVSREDWRYHFFLIMPLYAAFMGKSRIYFAICIIFAVMYLYTQTKVKRKFYLGMIPLAVLVLALMSVTSIADKIEATRYTDASYFDFWGTITNGRTVFWKWDLEAFFDLPVWQQFVGNGFNFVYDVNGAHIEKIWAHNDVINILMNFGYVGLVIYIWAFRELYRSFCAKESGIPWVAQALFLGAVFLNSMLNMSYTYLCAMISYPLFLCAISQQYSKKREVLWENN